MKNQSKKIINYITKNENIVRKTLNLFNFTNIYNQLDYNLIDQPDIFFDSFYSEDKQISLLERLMYLPFEKTMPFIEKIPANILYQKLNHSEQNDFFNKLICAAVHAKNKEAITFFNQKRNIPDSILISRNTDALKEQQSIHAVFEKDKVMTPASIAFQNHDYDMLLFLDTFKSYGWSGSITARFNIPLFTFLHKAIEMADVKTVEFITENDIWLINSKDHNEEYPVDYLSHISYEKLLIKENEYSQIFDMLFAQYKKHSFEPLKISNPRKIDTNIMIYFYTKLIKNGLVPDIVSGDIFLYETLSDFRNRKVCKNMYVFSSEDEFDKSYKNFIFLKSFFDKYKENKVSWKDFSESRISILSKSMKDFQNKYSFYDFQKEIDIFNDDNTLSDVSNIFNTQIKNYSITDCHNENELPCLVSTEYNYVSLNHINLAILFNDKRYLKKSLVETASYNNKEKRSDIFNLSNIISFNGLQRDIADALEGHDIYNTFIVDNVSNENGIVPVIYYSSDKNKLEAIDHKKLFENYLNFIIEFLNNDSFSKSHKIKHNLAIFTQHLKDSAFIENMIHKKMLDVKPNIKYFNVFLGLTEIRQDVIKGIALKKKNSFEGKTINTLRTNRI